MSRTLRAALYAGTGRNACATENRPQNTRDYVLSALAFSPAGARHVADPAQVRGAVPERATSDCTPFAHRTESHPRCVAPTALHVRES